MKTYLVVYTCAVALAAILTPWVAKLARRWRLLDAPGARKVHTEPTPRIGGIAIVAALLVSVLPVLLLNNLVGSHLRGADYKVIALLAGTVLVFAVGLLDDFKSIPSRVKLLAVLAAALMVCKTGTTISEINLGHWGVYPLGYMAWPVTVMWIAGVTVAINFIDGLDGLAAGIGAIACGVIAAVGIVHGQMVPAVLAVALLGSLTGFLFHNFHPAKIFMGDCGSMSLGFLLASTSVMCAAKAQTFLGIIVPALALGVPLLDTLFTMIRRGILQRRPLFAAERGHIHHRLMELGLCQKRTVLLLYGVSLVSALLGSLMLWNQGSGVVFFSAALLCPLAVFRMTGVARLRKVLAALKRNFTLYRSTQQCSDVFGEMHNRLRNARSIDEWWREVCAAAQMIGIAKMSVPLVGRDGVPRVLSWACAELAEDTSHPMTATLPLRHRRAGKPLTCEIQVGTASSMEMAGRRITAFSRLLEEHSLAQLPHSLRKRRGPAAVEDADQPTASLVSPSQPPAEKSRWWKRRPRQAAQEVTPAKAGDSRTRRVAVVHDFLYTYAGAERVLEQILNLYPDADLFSLFDFLEPSQRGFVQGKKAKTSFIQRLPLARTKHRAYLPLMPMAIEQMDVSAYDLVITSSYLAAKGVITRPDQLHVCYCHSPVRFAWDMQHQYLAESGLIKGVKSILVRCLLHYIRGWDSRSSNGVDLFVTNSDFVGRRIQKVYRRDSVTLYPPVDVEGFSVETEKEDFYLTVSRLVPYKRVDVIIGAFNLMPGKRLIVIGEGPDFEKLKAKAGPNVSMLGYQSFEHVKEYMQRAKAFVFAAEEDFGIVPVEAQACGTPVIAYARGGVTESVVDGRTGVFFTEQTPESLVGAIRDFESSEVGWNPAVIRANAERFSASKFREKFRNLVESKWMSFSQFKNGNASADEPAQTGFEARRATELVEQIRQGESWGGIDVAGQSDQPPSFQDAT